MCQLTPQVEARRPLRGSPGASVPRYAARMTTTPAPRPRRSTPRKPPPEVPQEMPASAQVPTVPLDVPIYRYRVLFTDGATVDFLAYSDHSGIRGQMLDQHFGKRPKTRPGDSLEGIAGIAPMGLVYVHMPNTNFPDPPST